LPDKAEAAFAGYVNRLRKTHDEEAKWSGTFHKFVTVMIGLGALDAAEPRARGLRPSVGEFGALEPVGGGF
jgi:hypothetical protein